MAETRDLYREWFGRSFEEHQRGWNAIKEWGKQNGLIGEASFEPPSGPAEEIRRVRTVRQRTRRSA